jgi:hypothetical protein
MPPELTRRRALIAFVSVVVGWAFGFAGFGWSLFAKTDAEMLTAARILKSVGTFAFLCNLTAIILGVQAIPRQPGSWKNARTFGIIAVTLGAIGLFGAFALLVLGVLFKECGSCKTHGCNLGTFYVD